MKSSFPGDLVWSETQTVSSRIWTRYLIYVERPTYARIWYMTFFVRTRLRTVDHTRPVVPQKFPDPFIFLQKGVPLSPGDQSVPPPERVRAWGDYPQWLKNCWSQLVWVECRLPGIHIRRPEPTTTLMKTHPTLAGYQATRPAEVCPSPVGQVVT